MGPQGEVLPWEVPQLVRALLWAALREVVLRWEGPLEADLREEEGLQWADLNEEEGLQWEGLQWESLLGGDLRWADLLGADLRWAGLLGGDLRWVGLPWEAHQ